LYDCAGKLIATTSTNYNGYYYFSNLNPGDYKVKFYTPTGYGFTKKDQGSNDEVDSDVDPNTGFTTCVTLTSGKNDLKWDAGIYCLPLSKLGDKVWVDTDKDGIQDYNESGIKNIKVELYNCSDKLLSTTYTDYYGKYYFNNLAAGDYKVKFYAPTGYGFTKKDQGSNDEVDSDVDPTTGFTTCITLTAGKTDLKWDAGIYCLPTSKLGDKVWLDKDKDGIQDSGEPGVKDVKVQLYSSTGTHLATTYTSYYGYYSFSNLTAGSYKVKFNLPAGYAFTKVDQGTSDEKDSDANQETGYTVTINLAAGVTDLKWDAGIVSKSSCFSPGYWKTHSKYGPANPYDPTWSKCGTKGEDTPFFKCGNSWYKAFHQSVEGNHYYILAHQYMAAKLNQHWGAFCPPDVKNALSECESIFNQYSPSQIKYGSTTLKNKCTTLASLLDKFNNQ
ncbi:MAG: hypothetical protein HXY50_12135, partial [Ignavibacteriaceae bacterium]|nr:hypothetical protein [Ignavibacteriaceae bacterium]